MQQWEKIGVITKAQEASFRQEMATVREVVDMAKAIEGMNMQDEQNAISQKVPVSDTDKWDDSLKIEMVNWNKSNSDITSSVNVITSRYIKGEFANWFTSIDQFYYIKSDNFAEKAYIYDKVDDIVFKIPNTRILRKKIHSVEELDFILNGEERKKIINNDYTEINYELQIVKVSELQYYEPDLIGVAQEHTYLLFYKKVIDNNGKITTNDVYEMPAKEWLSKGRPNETIKNGETYILYDYKNQIWANLKIKTSSLETNWTWIPRYSYSNSGTKTTSVFVNTSNELLNGEEGTYTIAPSFEGNELKGIWVSKFEPSYKLMKGIDQYYIPDIAKLDKNNTYLEIYSEDGLSFTGEKKLSEISNITNFTNTNNWYDYPKKMWANIKIVENGLETWWVWIPRYAYYNDGTTTNVIFIGTDNKPLDGSTLPSRYSIAPSFEGNNLKGIWVSKYEPSYKATKFNITNLPDLSGIDTTNPKLETYLVTYNEAGTEFDEYYKLSEITDLESFAKTHNWFDYSKNMWANIKIVNNQGTTGAEQTGDDVQTWWVWIPRYAYKNSGTTTEIMLLKPNQNQSDIPTDYTIAPDFEGNSLKGIWVSKYEPNNK